MSQFSPNKIFNHLDRVHEWRTTGLSRPVTIELDMTNLCDACCPYCFGYSDRINTAYSLTLEDAKDIIDQIKNFGGKAVTFTGGGEPLCNPHTMDAVTYAGGLGLDIGFITNGFALDKEKSRTIAENCTWVRVSLDAGTEDYYPVTHGLNGEVFNKVKENIAELVRIKKETGSSVTIGAGFLTFTEMTDDMLNFVELSRSLGVDYAQFRPLLKRTQDEEINEKSDRRIIRNLEQANSFSSKDFKVLCSVSKYEKLRSGTGKRSYSVCHGHHFAAVIASDKKMYLCCHMRGISKYRIGDLRKNSLKEIWQSEKRKKIYGSINFKDCPLLCRCDGMNEILWNISQKTSHQNFL